MFFFYSPNLESNFTSKHFYLLLTNTKSKLKNIYSPLSFLTTVENKNNIQLIKHISLNNLCITFSSILIK